MTANSAATNRRRTPLILYIALTITLVVSLITGVVTMPSPARGNLGATDFLKANGKFLRNNSGTGDIVTLRGTNLGGWLTHEDRAG